MKGHYLMKVAKEKIQQDKPNFKPHSSPQDRGGNQSYSFVLKLPR